MPPRVRLRFVGGGNIYYRAAGHAQLGFPYGHVGYLTDDNQVIAAHIEGGVSMLPAHEDAKGGARAIVCEIPCTTKQTALYERFMVDAIGQSYDMPAIYGAALGILIGRPPKLKPAESAAVCSALQYRAMIHAGFASDSQFDPRFVTPRDIFFIASGLHASFGEVHEP